MDAWPNIPLEDEYEDIIRKATRGGGLDRLDPQKLAASKAGSWHPRPVELPDVRHHPHDPHPSNGYVFFHDDGANKAAASHTNPLSALIDPAGVPENLLRILREGAYHLRYILITHKHADHCDATADVAKAFPDAQIVMHERDVHAIGSLASKALIVEDNEELPFGEHLRIRVLHTPGHTDGSISFLFKSTVFTGDTLFAGSVGGAYGDISTYSDILNSVRTRLFSLPDETVVMPGHGPPSTIAEEKHHNPFF